LRKSSGPVREVLPIDKKMERDAAEIMELIADSLHSKYVKPFEEMLKNQSDILSQNPPPEIRLLSALKPFVDSECCTVIDKLVYSYGMAAMAGVMAEDLMRSRRFSDTSALADTDSGPDAMRDMQFPGINIIIPLVILLIFSETH